MRSDLLQGAVFVIRAPAPPAAGSGCSASSSSIVPLPERRVEPDVVPAAEGRVGIVVVLRQACAQVGCQVGVARQRDAGRPTGPRPGRAVPARLRRRPRCGKCARRAARSSRRRCGRTARAARLRCRWQRVEQSRQHVERLAVHEVAAPGLLGGRAASSGRSRDASRPGRGSRRRRTGARESPSTSRAIPGLRAGTRSAAPAALLDAHECRWNSMRTAAARQRRARRFRTRHRLGHCDRPASRSRRRKRWILPVAVFGSSPTNSIQRGYLYGASRSLTKAFSSASAPARPLAGLQHDEGLGLGQAVGVGHADHRRLEHRRVLHQRRPRPRTARRRCRSTLSMSSLRPP